MIGYISCPFYLCIKIERVCEQYLPTPAFKQMNLLAKPHYCSIQGVYFWSDMKRTEISQAEG